jgi:hypothetical protein
LAFNVEFSARRLKPPKSARPPRASIRLPVPLS